MGGNELAEKPSIKCNRCGAEIHTYSKMRKWCADCRKEIAVLQAKARRYNRDWQEFDSASESTTDQIERNSISHDMGM